MTAVITAEDVEKAYGEITALRGLSLEVSEGEIYGFLGPNGAGKTTTIGILTGRLQPDHGTVSVLGHDPTTDPRAVREAVGILPERESPPSYLTPREFLQFVGESHDLQPATVDARIGEWMTRLEFEPALDTQMADLSQGQKQKIMIAKAFLNDPAVVFVDEPLSNLDPIIQEYVKDYLRQYREAGNTIFLSTHALEVADDLCTTVGILRHGELVSEHNPDALETASLRDVFLADVDADGRTGVAEEPSSPRDDTPAEASGR